MKKKLVQLLLTVFSIMSLAACTKKPTEDLQVAPTQAAQEETAEQATTVVFELQEMGPLVKLTILHDIDVSAAKFQQAAAGWTFILNGLKTYLETGAPMPALPWGK